MHRPALPALLLAAALSACAEQESPRACAAPSDCPAGARCRSAVCVANAPPVARIDVPASPVAFALVTLSGAGSFDPDPEDGLTTYQWTLRSAGAPCPPPAVASASDSVVVRFGCAGAHEVELTVTDGLGRPSAPAVAAVAVEPDPGPALVTAGADVALGHTCSGAPLLCRADASGGAVALSSTGPTGAGIRYAWTVQPPAGRALVPGRRVFFTPGADVPDPTVVIETDGLAISGDWVFRVEARDEAGALGAAAMRVSIGNRPPAVVLSPGPVPHHYDAVDQAFHATGEVGVAVTDPDGDPISSRQVTAHHAGDGAGASFAAMDLGDKVTLSITVPFDGPDSPGHLIGGAGLERSLRFSALDSNGAEGLEVWQVAVENEPPQPVGPAAPVSVDHVYSPSGSSYVAEAVLGAWADPDGDPLSMAAGTPRGPCASPTLTAGVVSVTCTHPFTGSPAADQLAGTLTLQHGVRDPWASSVVRSTPLTIRNRAPSYLVTSFDAPGTCSEGTTCCEFDPQLHVCLQHVTDWEPGAIPSGVFLADPDGDPLSVVFSPNEVTITPGSAVCTPSGCAFTFQPGAASACALDPVTAGVTVTDGASSVPGVLTVSRACP